MLHPLRTALVALPFLVAACGGGASEGETAAKPAQNDAEPAATDAASATADMFLGSPDAPVTVVEYASVTCPHCATFHETIFPDIKEKYVDTGKVKFVFREFPTPPAGLSYVGSVMARCAADKGGSDAYFLVLGALFKTQRTWIYADDPKAELVKIASQAGMSESDFDVCMKRQDLVDLINANVEDASAKHSINSTPSFVVDGEKIPAVRAKEDLEARLDEALAEAETGE